MNRRSFLARCLSGAVLGMARVLPMPSVAKVEKIVTYAQDGDVRHQTGWGPVTTNRIDVCGVLAVHHAMVQEWLRLCLETMTPEELDHYNRIVIGAPCEPS